MADQEHIQRIIEELSEKFQILQEEVISAMTGLVEGKTNAEAIAILNELDINAVMVAKASGILGTYTAGNIGTLVSKEMFAEITEDTLQVLLTQSEQYLAGQITAMGSTIKQEVVSGIINKNTVSEIVESLGKKGYGADVGMKRIVSDGMNNYSRAVSRMMMDEAPANTKYVYIGPADEKTRDFCLTAIQAGAITEDQIHKMGWTSSLSEGGGVNCRHGWEMASNDLRGQYHRGDEAEELLNG